MWVWLIPALLAGLALGFFVGWSGSRAARQSRQFDRELRQSHDEQVHYREQVAAHFAATADLVNAMSADYAAVLQHLTKGAQQLCGGEKPRFQPISVSEPPERVEAADAEKTALPASPPRLPGEKAAESSKPYPAQHAKDWYNEADPSADVTDYAKEDAR